MAKTISAFMFNGEREMLDIHLNVLNKQVDKFIICEAKTTFSGGHKPLYFYKYEHHYKKFWKKIEYYIIDENYSLEEVALAQHSPNTHGASHWKREFLQKESIKKALKNCNDEDICYIGDVDEVWEPYEGLYPAKLKLRVYAYYLDNRSNEEFWGTLVAPWGMFKNECLNHMRSNTAYRTHDYYGAHFTSMGGFEEVRRKLNDSYTPESYNTHDVQLALPSRHRLGVDYLGRDFTFKIDTRDWPQFLKDSTKYRHLCREITPVGVMQGKANVPL